MTAHSPYKTLQDRPKTPAQQERDNRAYEELASLIVGAFEDGRLSADAYEAWQQVDAGPECVDLSEVDDGN